MSAWDIIVYAGAIGLGWLIISVCLYITVSLARAAMKDKI